MKRMRWGLETAVQVDGGGNGGGEGSVGCGSEGTTEMADITAHEHEGGGSCEDVADCVLDNSVRLV